MVLGWDGLVLGQHWAGLGWHQAAGIAPPSVSQLPWSKQNRIYMTVWL